MTGSLIDSVELLESIKGFNVSKHDNYGLSITMTDGEFEKELLHVDEPGRYVLVKIN